MNIGNIYWNEEILGRRFEGVGTGSRIKSGSGPVTVQCLEYFQIVMSGREMDSKVQSSEGGPGNTNVCSSAHRQDLAIRLNRSEHAWGLQLEDSSIRKHKGLSTKPAKTKWGGRCARAKDREGVSWRWEQSTNGCFQLYSCLPRKI